MSSEQQRFEEKIRDRSLVVGIVGLGYVGLPLARAFFEAGFRVIGFDVDPEKPKLLADGVNYLKHLGEDYVKGFVGSDRFEATTDFGRLGEPDAVISCVPTPLGKHLEPDLSYVEQTTEDIARTLRKGQLVALESTTYPRTTREVMLPRLEASGLKCGEDFFLAYSPEREDPGRKDHSTATIPKLVGGVDEVSGKLAHEMYDTAIASVIHVSSAEVAESAKLLENIFRAVNIALVNEMKVVMTAMGVDVWEVVEAAKTKPFGFMPFYPGPGLGGHCIPIDPFYLTWKAREYGLATRFIELAGEVNRAMPEFVIDRLADALNDREKSVKGSKVLVLGLAYKPDVDDLRESPSFELIELLLERGAKVEYNDPHIPTAPKVRKHDLQMSSVDLTPASLASYDCVLISTNHKAYDYQMIGEHSKLIVDSRNAMDAYQGDRGHIVKA
ncbi:MAG: nucleotide sugar dehydrogenase [Planctomycetota bacterium]